MLPVPDFSKKTEQWVSRLSDFFILVLFAVHPLVISTRTYYDITSTKLYFYVGTVSFTVAVFIVLLVALKANNRNGLPERPHFFARLRAYEWFLLIYWLVLMASSILAEHPKYALLGSTKRNEGFLMMTVYLFSVVFAGRFYRVKEWHFIMFCLVSAMVSALGICQYYGLDLLQLNPEAIAGVKGPEMVYISTMSNRNLLSTYLCLSFCICLVMFSQKKKHSHWFFLPMGLVVFYMLILGQSESGYVGIFFSLCFLFPLIAKSTKAAGRLLVMFSLCIIGIWISVKVHDSTWPASSWALISSYLPVLSAAIGLSGTILWAAPALSFPNKAFSIGWYILILLVIILVIHLIPYLAVVSDHKTIQDANEIIKGNFDDRLGSNRMFVWKRSLSMVPERLWLGHGPDSFYILFTSRYGKETIEKNFVNYDKAHNEYIQNLFDNGVLGLCSLLTFYGIVLYRIHRGKKDSVSLGIYLSLVCFMIQAFFNFSSPFAHPIVWAMWGIGAGIGYRQSAP